MTIELEKLAFSIYSINKYAKNYRDSLSYLVGDEYIDSQFKMSYLYNLKEQALSRFTPIQIHKQVTKEKVYREIPDNSEDFKKERGKSFIRFDEQSGIYRKYKKSRRKTYKTLYFLYYEIEGYKYHIPVNEEKIKKMNCLQTVNLPHDFYIEGEDPDKLMDENEAIKIINEFLNSTSADE